MPGVEAAAGERPSGYPTHWEADVLLADGAAVHLRPILPTDADRLVAFHNRQSPESIYFRFFSPRPRLSARDVERFTNVDYRDRMAFVAILGDELLGVARFDRTEGTDSAEVAFFTDDRHQGRGLATLLLEYLAAAAREQGIATLTAQTLPQNRKMLGVFRQAGFEVSTRLAEGVIDVRLGIEPTSETLAAIAERERRAEARSIARLLSPRSVAVIGAGRQRGGLGHEVLRNLVAGGFEGPVFPVNASATHVASISTHASVTEIEPEVDLAVIAVPAPDVAGVVAECAAKGVRGLIIISAGFAEVGPGGAQAQREIVELARRHGMRLVGPNCMGVINTAPAVALRATFAPVAPEPGGIGFLSQSGTLGTAIIETMGELGLGVSTFVSLGNKADVSANDLLQYWEEDERTDAVLLYMESFGNLRKFSRIARSVSRVKPIVAVSRGAVDLGETEGIVLPAEATLDALLRHVGVIRVPTMDLLFDVTRLLLRQPVPMGDRVAIVSNSSGPARLALEACRGAGLTPAHLGDETQQAVGSSVPIATHLDSPLDLTYAAGPAEYEAALDAVLADAGVDSVIVVFAPPIEARTAEVAEAVSAAAARSSKPVVATILGASPRRRGEFSELPVPVFSFPEEAARALGRVASYGVWLATPAGRVPDLDSVEPEATREIVARLLESGATSRNLSHGDAAELLATVGLSPLAERTVSSCDEAARAADEIGYPVVLKATGLSRVARSEMGGLAVDLHSASDVRRSHDRMVDALGDAMRPALVQQMASAGTDIAIRIVQEESVGSVIMLGMGGAVLEQVGFDSLSFLPLTDLDAERLIERSHIGARLPAESAERARLVETLLRLGALCEAAPELAELVLNPLIVSGGGAAITDVELRLEPRPVSAVPLRRLDDS